jgi:hypothetical protein
MEKIACAASGGGSGTIPAAGSPCGKKININTSLLTNTLLTIELS